MPRRLPVLPSPSGETGPGLSTTQWSLIVAACSLLIWLPLAWLSARLGVVLCTAYMGASDAASLSRAVSTASPAVRALALGLQVLPIVLSFALAVATSGVLVGRFGGTSGLREAIVGGLLSVVTVLVLVSLSDKGRDLPAMLAAFAALGLVACPSAWVGVRLGRWGRHRSQGPLRT